MYANTAASEETACLTGYCMGYSTWITEPFFLFYSWINAIENPHTQASVALRSCKLVKFFIQNLTGECVYLIEVPAYFTTVKFRINIAHDFLRETLKEIEQRWTSDTCQPCLGVGGALNFRESTQLKSQVTFSKNNSAQSRKHPITTFGRAQSRVFLPKALHCCGSSSAGGTCWRWHRSLQGWHQHNPIPHLPCIGCHPSAPSPARFYFPLLSDTELGLGFSSSLSAWES